MRRAARRVHGGALEDATCARESKPNLELRAGAGASLVDEAGRSEPTQPRQRAECTTHSREWCRCSRRACAARDHHGALVFRTFATSLLEEAVQMEWVILRSVVGAMGRGRCRPLNSQNDCVRTTTMVAAVAAVHR